jgi:hypothetical protein
MCRIASVEWWIEKREAVRVQKVRDTAKKVADRTLKVKDTKLK